jgi:lantibiotic modifying enzyme
VPAWLLSQANALGDEILRRASEDADELRWLTFDAMPGKWARHAFYDGSVGAAVFLAGWARVADRSDARAAVQPAVAGLLRLIEKDAPSAVAEVGIGGCTGVGSLLYGLCVLDALTADRTYCDAASRLARTLTPAHAAADVTYDVTGGSAGTILGLLAVHAATGDETMVALARPFADHLLARQLTQATGAAWPTTRRGTPIAGFAHGSAGIALALARLAEISRNERYRAAAARAVAHERTLFAPSLANWPVLGALDPSTGSGHSIMTAWCHGAAGIGLARACLPTASRDAESGSEMATALAAIDASPLTALDQICCGNLGRADILITLGQHLDRPDVVGDGIDLAGRAADRAALRQFYGLRASGVDYRVFDPGLFRGLAGIAYVLLRAARPDALPSVLTYAPFRREARA